MAFTTIVVVQEDPRKSHRPVEALRIALGLAAADHAVTVVLLDTAPILLREDTEDLIDRDILETYLPSFKQLAIPFVTRISDLPQDTQPGLVVQKQAPAAIHQLIATADHTLVF
jgi:hypothetical protein